MAVKTLIPFDHITEIMAGYKLGDVIGVSPISEGTVQTNYILSTTNHQLVFRYYENRPYQSVLFEVDLIRHLCGNGYPCPAPFQNNLGEYAGLYMGKPYVIFEYVEGEHIAKPDRQQRNQVIEQAARLHLLTEGYTPAFKDYRLNYDIETCRRLAEKHSLRIGTPDSRDKLKWYLSQLDQLQLPEALPKGICHCDFHFTNILYKNGRFKALLDFDNANYTYLLFDLAYLLDPFKPSFDWNKWSTFHEEDDVLDFSSAKTVISEYEKYRKLDGVEVRYLFDVIKLSILVDCLWYFERGDAKDFFEKRKIDCLDRLGRDGFRMRLFDNSKPA